MKEYKKPSMKIKKVVVEKILALSAVDQTSTDDKMYAPDRHHNSIWDYSDDY